MTGRRVRRGRHVLEGPADLPPGARWPTLPADPAAVAALLGNLAARPVTYSGAHGVRANHNGDPVCICGWDPAARLPPELRRTQVEALSRVNQHIAAESPA